MKNIKFRSNENGMIELLPTIAISVIILFAVAYVGTYLNGTIASALTDTYPTNQPSGSIDNTYWHNATTSNTSRNISLPCSVGGFRQTTTTYWSLFSNGSALIFNLTVNGNSVNDTSVIPINTYVNHTLASLVTAGNVSNSDTYLNFTWNVNNSGNRIRIDVTTTYHSQADWRTPMENASVETLGNLSSQYDSTLNIVVIAAIITVLTIPLMAIVAIKRLI